VDVVDLLADVGAGLSGAVVLDAGFPRVDASVVARLSSAAPSVVGVSADEAGERRLRQWGIEAVVSVSPKRPGEAAVLIAAALAEGGGAATDPRDQVLRASDGALLGQGQLGTSERDQGRSAPGSVVAVWGPVGAPGRTTVAVAIAEQLAAAGCECMVADADVQAPGVGDLLGMPSDVSGLIAACRQADQGTLDVASLARAARSLGPRLRVLTGLPHPSRRPELRPAALRAVWATARALAEFTVVDIGGSGEADLDDRAAFDEFAAAMVTPASGVLGVADLVVAVTGCEPLAVARMLSTIGQVTDTASSARLHVVINKVRGSVVGNRELAELTALLTRRLNPSAVWVVADERDACDRAAVKGLTLCEYAPTSRASRALAEVAAGVARDARRDVYQVG
ncbi:MAG: hypothetical protein WCP28_16345, partial [Actinomycetes bacterium]